MKNHLYKPLPQIRFIVTALLLCCGLLVGVNAIANANPQFEEIECEGNAAVSGTVIDARGNPVADAEVSFSKAWECMTVLSNTNGEFTIAGLSDGEGYLQASPAPDDHGAALFHSQIITATLIDSEAVQVDEPLRVRGAQAFIGVVLPGITVDWIDLHGEVIFAPAGAEGNCDSYSREDPQAFVRSIQDDSIAYLEGPVSGNFCIAAEIEWASLFDEISTSAMLAPAPTLVNVPENVELFNLGQIEFLPPPKHILGSVVDSDGVGIAEVEVRASDSPELEGENMLHATTDASGNFTFTVSGGSWYLEMGISQLTGHVDDRFREVTFAADETEEEATVQFDLPVPSGTVAFAELIFNGPQIDGAYGQVVLQPVAATESCAYYATYGPSTVYGRITENGIAAFDAVAPGDYCMSAELDYEMMFVGSHATVWLTPPATRVSIPVDAQMLDLGEIEIVAPSKRITGSVIDGAGNSIPDAFIEVQGTAPAPWGVDSLGVGTDASGNFTFTVSGGVWEVRLHQFEHINDRVRQVNFADNNIEEIATVYFNAPQIPSDTIALTEITFSGPQVDGVFGHVVLQPISAAESCGYYANHEASTVYEDIRGSGIATFDAIAPGDYCMSAELDYEMMNFGSRATVWLAPSARLVTIPADAQMLDLGQIEFTAAPKQIVGSVVDEAGVGIADVNVDAQGTTPAPWGSDWLNVMTDASGIFTFTVTGGEWDINISVNQNTNFTDDTYRQVVFADDDDAEENIIQFGAQNIDSAITGRLLKPDGSAVVRGSGDLDTIWINAWNFGDSGAGYSEIAQDGSFTMEVAPGRYQVNISINSYTILDLFAPEAFEVIVEEGEIVELGEIMLSSPQVMAQVVSPDGVPIDTAAYFNTHPTVARDDGTLTCDISDHINSGFMPESGIVQIGGLPNGSYCTKIEFLANESNVIEPLELFFVIDDENSSIDLGNVAVAVPTKKVAGQVTLEDGSGVEGMYIYASNLESGEAKTSTDAAGNFEFDLTPGDWEITLNLYPPIYPIQNDSPLFSEAQKWFTNEVSQIVSFASTATEELIYLTYAVTEANSGIVGTLLKPDGTPAIGVQGFVYASSYQYSNQFTSVSIDPETATYKLDVLEGEWQVGLSLYNHYNGAPNSTYISRSQSFTVDVDVDETVQQDFALQAFDTTIRGTVYRSDGSPVEGGYAWASSIGDSPGSYADIHRTAKIVNGEFEIDVLSGPQYEVGVNVDSYVELSEILDPDAVIVEPQPSNPSEVVMQFTQPDGAQLTTLVGTVYLSNTVPISESANVAALAEISAWSENGQYRQVVADENGGFNFSALVGSIWHVSAVWFGDTMYTTESETIIELTDGEENGLDLTVVEEEYSLPPEVDATFNINETYNQVLADGTKIEIPAGAVPVDDAEGDDVRVVVTPLTTTLPESYVVDTVEYGYDIQLFDVHTGEAITSTLNQDIVVTYQYSEDALAEMNANESTLAPAVRTAGADVWVDAENFVVNAGKNEIRLSISQAADAAITARPRRVVTTDGTKPGTIVQPTSQERSIFMPILVQTEQFNIEQVLSDGGLVLELGQGAEAERIVVDATSNLAIQCPSGVICDANYQYRAHQYHGEHVGMYFSFSPEIVDNYSLTSIVENFNYLNFGITFPERQTANSTVRFAPLEPLRVLGEQVDLLHTDGMSLELISYEDSRLRGTVEGVMTVLTTHIQNSLDPECRTGDIVGSCYEEESTYQPFVLHFNLLVEESE